MNVYFLNVVSNLSTGATLILITIPAMETSGTLVIHVATASPQNIALRSTMSPFTKALDILVVLVILKQLPADTFVSNRSQCM